MTATCDLGDLVFTGEIHPYADRWPMRTPDELEAMAESIRANGLRLPIILTPDGVLVDGRNRLRACEVAGITPTFEARGELTSEDAVVAFIWDMNGDHRRHMSKGQIAMMAALRPGTQSLVSKNSRVSSAYVAKARVVTEFLDEWDVASVIKGDLSLESAYEKAQEIKATVQAEEIARRKAEKAEREEAERRAAQLADLREHRPDLAALVDEDKLPLDEALSLRSREAAKERARAEAERQAIRNLLNDVHMAFTVVYDLQVDSTLRKVLDNWEPQSRDWTAADLHNLADHLHAIADRWEPHT